MHTRTHTHIHTQTHECTQAHGNWTLHPQHLCQSTSSKKRKEKTLRRLINPVDSPVLKQNGNSQTRSSYFVKGVSKVKSNAIKGKEKKREEKKKNKGSTVVQREKKSYCFSFILPGLLLPSLSVRCDSISFLSLALSVNRSYSPLTQMLWMECPAWFKWLATGLSLWCFMSARCSLKRVLRVRPVSPM